MPGRSVLPQKDAACTPLIKMDSPRYAAATTTRREERQAWYSRSMSGQAAPVKGGDQASGPKEDAHGPQPPPNPPTIGRNYVGPTSPGVTFGPVWGREVVLTSTAKRRGGGQLWGGMLDQQPFSWKWRDSSGYRGSWPGWRNLKAYRTERLAFVGRQRSHAGLIKGGGPCRRICEGHLLFSAMPMSGCGCLSVCVLLFVRLSGVCHTSQKGPPQGLKFWAG